MYIHDSPTRLLPDVASQEHALAIGTLDWVGMDGMEMPVAFDAGDGDVRSTGARVGAFVNLGKPEVRGIHMSRLYLLVSEALSSGPLTIGGIKALLQSFLTSHEGLSDHARITIGFEHLVRRNALRSDNSGWRAYPITIDATLSFSMLVAVAWFWKWRADKTGSEPDELGKMIIGSVFSVAGGLCLVIAAATQGDGKIGLFWPMMFHLLNSIGFSHNLPVSLALFTRLAPKQINAR